MLFYMIAGYLLVSEIVVLGLLGLAYLAKDCPEDEDEARVSYGRVLIVNLIFAPFSAPWMLYQVWRCWQTGSEEQAYWNSVLRSHQELSLDPLHECNMNESLVDYVEQRAPFAYVAGYERIGAFWTKGEPYNGQTVLFLHPDGHSFVEIGLALGCLYCELISYLDDGSVVESANCESIPIQNALAEQGYHVQCLPDAELDDLIAANDRLLRKLSGEKGVPVRCILIEQWRDYFHYHNHKFGQISFEIGEKDEGPKQIQFPDAKSVDSQGNRPCARRELDESVQPVC